MKKYDNVTVAFQKSLEDILNNGSEINVRESLTKELSPTSFTIENPLRRVYIILNRKNNIFSTIAETLWVIGGRNDIQYLSYYLPRSKDFSDDGVVWRAGYGQRLRNWNGIDQFKEIVNLIKSDPNTRRAVMSIFDPALDFVNSRDIPCNNWLHFLVRNNKLDLSVAVRSCDIMWGFTGINTFEWSVIQELIAFWTGYEVGKISFFIGSFHLYERHFNRAKEIITTSKQKTVYDFGYLSPKFHTHFDTFGTQMEECFKLEDSLRNNIDVLDEILNIKDDFLRNSMLMLTVHHYWKAKKTVQEIEQILNLLDDYDYKISAHEFFLRQNITLNVKLSEKGKTFFEYYSDLKSNNEFSLDSMVNSIKALHYKKTLVYKNSWKKHGELLGILANLSRKFDRIETLFESNIKPTADETLVDTVVDLAIYAIKYLTFIAEKYSADFLAYFSEHIKKENLHQCINNEGFDYIIDTLIKIYMSEVSSKQQSQKDCFTAMSTSYKSLEYMLIESKDVDNKMKCEYCSKLATASIRYLDLTFQYEPTTYNLFKNFVNNL